jgi:DNA-nicking Smr family endonuclease
VTKITEEAKQLFRQSIGEITPLRCTERIERQNRHQVLKKRLHLRRRGLPEIWFSESDEPHTVNGLARSETSLIFQRCALPSKQLSALKNGHFSTRCVIDLHGLSEAQAEEKMKHTLQRCHQRSDRYLLVVHGKGLSGSSEHPILKNWLNWWLRNQARVLAFHTAQLADGGSGALYVLLAPVNHHITQP